MYESVRTLCACVWCGRGQDCLGISRARPGCWRGSAMLLLHASPGCRTPSAAACCSLHTHLRPHKGAGQHGLAALTTPQASPRPPSHLAVEAVRDAPVPGDGVPKVLDLEPPLEPAGKEAAKRRQQRRKRRQRHLGSGAARRRHGGHGQGGRLGTARSAPAFGCASLAAKLPGHAVDPSAAGCCMSSPGPPHPVPVPARPPPRPAPSPPGPRPAPPPPLPSPRAAAWAGR